MKPWEELEPPADGLIEARLVVQYATQLARLVRGASAQRNQVLAFFQPAVSAARGA